jgi:hypothetical protein
MHECPRRACRGGGRDAVVPEGRVNAHAVLARAAVVLVLAVFLLPRGYA